MRIFIFSIVLMFSSLAAANTGAFPIAKLQVEWGEVYVVNSNFANPKNCDIKGMVKLERSSTGFKEMYSMALTAYTTNEKIGFWITKCGSSPWGKTIPVAYVSYLSK